MEECKQTKFVPAVAAGRAVAAVGDTVLAVGWVGRELVGVGQAAVVVAAGVAVVARSRSAALAAEDIRDHLKNHLIFSTHVNAVYQHSFQRSLNLNRTFQMHIRTTSFLKTIKTVNSVDVMDRFPIDRSKKAIIPC